MDRVNKDEMTYIDLRVIWQKLRPILRRFWVLLLILTVLGGVLSFVYAKVRYSPRYQCEAVFSVTANEGGSSGLLNYSYYYDNTAAQQAVSTFPYLLNSDVMREQIRQELDSPVINGEISASSVSGTNFFVLTVKSGRAEDAYDIIRAVMEVYPQVSRKVIGDTQLVIDREPILPTEPYNRFAWHRTAAKGAAVGLLLGLVLLTTQAMLRRTVMSTGDIKKVMNLNCLTRVPNVTMKKRKSSTAASLLIPLQEPDSDFCESFRMLRLKLQRQLTDEDKILMVTSTVPSEGKSSMAVNIALTFAQAGKKVLLVDGDLRGPSIKSILGITEPSQGLEEYLRAAEQMPQLLRYQDSDLYLIAGDAPVSNPNALLRRRVLKQIMLPLREAFDYIIVDTPPCEVMVDASALSALADKVVYVIREDYATVSRICSSVQSLSDSGADICGYILNRTAGHSSRYGYGYGYGKYGYRGYGYGKKEE